MGYADLVGAFGVVDAQNARVLPKPVRPRPGGRAETSHCGLRRSLDNATLLPSILHGSAGAASILIHRLRLLGRGVSRLFRFDRNDRGGIPAPVCS